MQITRARIFRHTSRTKKSFGVETLNFCIYKLNQVNLFLNNFIQPKISLTTKLFLPTNSQLHKISQRLIT